MRRGEGRSPRGERGLKFNTALYSPLHQDREADRPDASKGYEVAACTGQKAAFQTATGQADLKAAYMQTQAV